jgi:hypothetical protein
MDEELADVELEDVLEDLAASIAEPEPDHCINETAQMALDRMPFRHRF